MKRLKQYFHLFICLTLVASIMPLFGANSASAAGVPYVKSISSSSHSLALMSDGTIWSWGNNDDGQLGDGTDIDRNVPVQVKDSNGTAISDIIAISTGGYHSLALKSDGTVLAWGYNYDGQLGDGTYDDSNVPVQVKGSDGNALSNIISIAAGDNHSLALTRDNKVLAWGENDDGQLGIGTYDENISTPIHILLEDIMMIAAGSDHSLALKSDGTVLSWGYNYNGQLGNGTETSSNEPSLVKNSGGTDPISGIVSISAGSSHSLALGAGGTVWSWGFNLDGQLGNNSSDNSSLPVQVVDSEGNLLRNIAMIDAGSYHNLALQDNGKLWAWGSNYSGELGDGSIISSQVAVLTALTEAVSITAGSGFSLALKADGTVWAWGYNGEGQHGDGVTFTKSTPVQPTVTGSVYSISAGRTHSLAVMEDRTVWAWGGNSNGQLGAGPDIQKSTVPIPTLLSGAIAVATGYDHSIALKSDNTVWAWGAFGRLGNNTNINNSPIPVQVQDSAGTGVLSNITSIAAGATHSLALRSDGTVWAWGYNSKGQLGNGSTIAGYIPVQVTGLSGIIAIASGAEHSLALKSDGTVWAWGFGLNGQLGNGSISDSNVPVQVKDSTGTGVLGNITSIATGGYHSLATRSDGTVWSWGYNYQGQLGDGSTEARKTPVQVMEISDIISVDGGNFHSLALKSDYTVWAWGQNENGQLGDDTVVNRQIPVQVKGSSGTSHLSNIVAVSAGDRHSLATDNAGEFWGWGDANEGQIGDGTSQYKVTPIQVPAFNSVSYNNDLSGLVLSQGTLNPVFSAVTTSYSTSVDNAVSSIAVTPITADDNASVTVSVNSGTAVTTESGEESAALALAVGDNTVEIEVTAENGLTKLYVVTVTRGESTNADLAGLTLSQGTLSPVFAADTTSYSASVVNTVVSATVTPTVAESNAIVTVSLNNGTAKPVTSGVASEALALNVGENTIKVEVTAQNDTTKTYTVLVTRAVQSGSSTDVGGGSPTPINTPVVSTDGNLTLPSGRTGKVSLDNEVTVNIPGGAAVKELKLTIEKLLNTQNLLTNNEVLASPIYEILKNFSEDFTKPVELTFTFEPADVKSNQRAVVSYFDEVKKVWVEVGGKVDGNKITVEVNHFTKFAVMVVGQTGDVAPTDPTTNVSFSDISGHWAEANIKQAVSSGIVNGYLDGTFKPGKTVTRAEFAVLLMNALKPEGEDADLTFTDREKIGSWAQKAVAQAVQAGIINGYANGTFRPNAEVTRAEMAVMIALALGQSIEANAVTGFADDGEIPAWAKGSVAYVEQVGIVNGKGNHKFAPHDYATRAEAVTIVLNMLVQKK